MRPFLLALALLPMAIAQADEHEHGSLDKHEHGIASLNLALEGNQLEIELESPTMNIVGFEHLASSAADQAKASTAQAALMQPLSLFGLPAAADCKLIEAEVESALFNKDEEDEMHTDGHGEKHSDVDAEYTLTCSQPEALTWVDLSGFFKQFPATEKIATQLIGPNGQQGAELSAGNPRISF
jgi:hypothetical protein